LRRQAMLDFNGIEPARPFKRFDLDAIVDALRRDAKVWVPQHFPKGRREGNVWRLANIQGAPPRKQGSCVIALDGPNAGDWMDFDGSGSGGPLSALEEATGLKLRELYSYAATLVGQVGTAEASVKRKRANGAAQPKRTVTG
jgi:putative DNA primase/helicase